MTTLIPTMIILAVIGSGLIAGLFFVFSNFAMQALSKLPANYGSAAMQSVNVTIINPQFMVVFLGTAVLSFVSAIFAGLNLDRPGSGWILAGGILYLVGSILVTIRFNVPLNDQLAALDPELPENFPKWQAYVSSWMPWNHVRTASTAASAAAFAIALTKLNH